MATAMNGQTVYNGYQPVYPSSSRSGINRQVLDVYLNLFGSLLPPTRTVAKSNVHVRHGFLKKVYGLLSAQLLLTTVIAALFISYPPLAYFVKSSSWVLWGCIMASLALVGALHANRREYPLNMMLLGAFTIVEAVLIGVIVTSYSLGSVLQAAFLTCSVTILLTCYTFQSRRDFSSWGAGLFAALWILLAVCIMQIYLRNELLDMVTAAAGAIIFSMYIIYDTHMIMEKVSPEEYIDATINLYLDIVNLFIDLLRLLGKREN